MFWNAFIIALREIRRNLTRAFLTVIGVAIGVAAVVTLVTLGRGATESVKAQIEKVGSNLLTLTGYKGMDPEVSLFGLDGLSPGNDQRDTYPTTRMFTIGANLSF